MPALLIDIDKYKEKLSGYRPENAEDYHIVSANLADTDFDEAVKSRLYDKVYFLCGGSAVGKSEFVSSYLIKDEVLIFDSTFSSHTGVKAKLSKTKKYEITVFFIQPKNLLSCFLSFKGRKRQFDHKHFVRTHAGSREMALFILQKYKHVNVRCFVSELDFYQKMSYEEIIVEREGLIQSLKNNQLTKEIISSIIKPYLRFYEKK
jgi:hypothetical protein